MDTPNQPFVSACTRFVRLIDGCTKPHPDGREVVHSVPLREAAEDIALARASGNVDAAGLVRMLEVTAVTDPSKGRPFGAGGVIPHVVVDAVEGVAAR